MKRIVKILIATLIFTVLAFALASCGGDVTVSTKEGAMPQTVFVLGEEIDLSSGVLVVDENGEKKEIAMNAEGVSVSGYDKNTLGEQKITVTYKEQSVELTVTVVERMQVVDFTADYLKGDVINLSKGRLKITRNDGSNYTVILKSDKVKVEGFSSASVGAKELTATYTSGSDTYTAKFTVNIHNVESVALTKPTKVTYNSHDAGIELNQEGNVAGAKLTLSALNGQLKKDIDVTEDMIRGFDLSAVNATNSPLTQTVNVEYDGKLYPFEIVIKYTSVSNFKDNAGVANYAWSGDDVPDITEAHGETALKMMELYLDMSPAEQSLLTREETLNMARTAMIYGFQKWGEDLNEFEGAFKLEDLAFELQCTDRESVASALTKLQDTTRPIYTLYDVLNGMITTFGENEEILFTFTNVEGAEDGIVDMYFSEYPTVDPAFFELLVDVFAYMLELDTLMDAVGTDWQTNIEAYSDEIEAVYDKIVNGEFYSNDFSQFFYYVSMWRPEDDAFDFLYYYYYEIKADVSSIIAIANIRLPSALEEIFAHVYEAMNQIDYLSQYMASDTTQFFYHYFMACDLAQDILTSEADEDKMLQVLFYGLPLNSMLGLDASEMYTFNDMISYLTVTEGGYYSLCGSLLDLPEFEALMDKYLEIIVRTFEEETYQDSAEYVSDVKAMLALYMQLTPAQQFSFLGSLNAFYAMNIPPLAFDNTGEYAELICLFVDMLNDVYTGLFTTEAGKNAYLSLVFASEAYAQRFTSDAWITTFRTNMQVIADALAGSDMSAADKSVFEAELRVFYNKYLAILAEYPETDDGEEPVAPDLGEWEDELKALKDAVTYLEASYYAIQYQMDVYNLFFSAFERAQQLYNDILANAPESVKYELIHGGLYEKDETDSEGNATGNKVYWSYDYVMSVYRTVYVNALINLGVYELYFGYGMDEFMNLSYELYWVKDMDKSIAAMEYFIHMDVEAQIMFIIYFGSDENYNYYAAIESSLIDAEYAQSVRTAMSKLMDVEMGVIVYNYYLMLLEEGDATQAEIDEIVAELNAYYADFVEAYEAITDAAELEQFNDFINIYNFYKSFIESVNASAAA